MQITAFQSPRAAADVAPEQLAGNASLSEPQKVAEGARQFEALLLRQILQETQKTVIKSKFADNSTSAGIYRDMVTSQLADSISKSGSLGLAKSLEGQLTGQLQRTSAAGQNPAPTASPTAPLGPIVGQPPLRDAHLGAPHSERPRSADRVALAPAHRS